MENDTFKILHEQLKKAYQNGSIKKEVYLQILFSLKEDRKQRLATLEQIAFILPKRNHPVTDLEQKMIELNVILFEKFGNIDVVSKIVNDVFRSMPEDNKDKETFLNVVNHFEYLAELISGNPAFLEIILERNSYKTS